MMDRSDVEQGQMTSLRTPSDLGARATIYLSVALATLLADMFALSRQKTFTGTCSDPTFANII
jgi:hypothetical protein